MHQDERCTGNWPAGFAGFVRQDFIETRCVFPVSACCCRLESFVIRRYKHTVFILHYAVSDFIFFGVSVLNIANRTLDALYERSNAFIAFAANACRPGNRTVIADFCFPFRADFSQIIGKHEGGARAV